MKKELVNYQYKGSNRITKTYFSLYALFWFYTEFWLPPEERRPYTFIMRDIYHQYPLPVVTGIAIFFYSMGAYWYRVEVKVFSLVVASLFIGELLGHLFWGGKYLPGEQELPTYNPLQPPQRYEDSNRR